MSLWTTIRNGIESPISAIGGLATGIASSFLGNNDKGNDDQRAMINEQIKAYKDQTALTKQQLDQTRSEQMVEKRRIEQKQIRALRGNYRSAGLGANMLGAGDTSDMNSKLGG